VQRSSVGYSLAHRKNICPRRPEFGLKEDILFLEIVYFLFGGEAKLRWAVGAQRPVGRGNELKKTGARSARARTRGQNPLVLSYSCLSLLRNAELFFMF
jgi:hypothetical protein